MAMLIKQNEARIHDKLYDTIKLLTHIYPTTKDFNDVFKRNMFVKSNKAAFQHVIHYLFTILSPELTKEKITWPLYDVKLESTFRNEVIAFINHINVEYEHANIPNLMASHLMSPGGYKFARFMLKLLMVVVHEHLRRNENVELEMLGPIRPHKDATVTNVIIKNIKAWTLLKEREVEEISSVFSRSYEKVAQEAECLVAEQTQAEAELCTTKKLLEEKKEKMGNYQTQEALITRLDELQEKMDLMEQVSTLCKKCGDLLTYLSSDKPVLEFKKDDLVVCGSLKHLFNVTNDELNLRQLFHSLSVVVQNESLDMASFSEEQLNDMTKLVTDLREKYSQLENKLSTNKNELIELSENFSHVDDCSKFKKNPVIVLTCADNV